MSATAVAKRMAAAFVVVAALFVLRALSCGGRIYGNPDGYLDDAGTYHFPDGAIMFGPGTACGNYDPANFPNLYPPPSCDGDDFCKTWLAQTVPPGYLTDPACFPWQGKQLCGATWSWDPHVEPEPRPIYCTPGPTGDAYCSARLSQFVLGGGRAGAYCEHQCNVISPEHGGSPYCASDGPDFYACKQLATDESTVCQTSGQVTSKYEICVYRGDAGRANAEVPCAPPPPPTVPDAGDDAPTPIDAGDEP